MSDVLLLQNTRIEGSGHLGQLLSDDGFDITSVHAKHEEIPKKHFSFAVILGAPESANDDLPYLIEEQKLIKNYVENSIPVLGICLGSQLIAKTFGKKFGLMVNSGSSANVLMLSALKESGYMKNNRVVVPSVAWSTDLAPVMQLGFEPILCDSNMEDLSVDLEHLEIIFKGFINDINHLFFEPRYRHKYKHFIIV